MKSIEYSVIIPVYNSSHTLKELYNRIVKTLSEYTFEVIFVDDGSTDNSWETIKEIQKEFSATGYRLSKNYGQHNATLCGLINCSGKYAVTIDDDLQTPPEEIKKLIVAMNAINTDVIYGVYHNQKQKILKSTLRKTLMYLTNIFYSKKKEASSFRLINNNIILCISKHNQSIISIDEIILWYTDKISNIEVQHFARKHGESGYSVLSLSKIAFSVLFSYYSFPLNLIISIGFYTSIFSISLGLFYLIKKIFFNVSIEGWTSLIVSILFSTGLIVFSLGITGRYVLQILSNQYKKPGYNISEKVGE